MDELTVQAFIKGRWLALRGVPEQILEMPAVEFIPNQPEDAHFRASRALQFKAHQ